MRLTELHPRFVGYGGEGVSDQHGNPVPFRHGIGLACDCPCGKCDPRFKWLYVPFENPLDGGPPVETKADKWHRVGTDFENITLTPSILRNASKGGCGWHGYITNGNVTEC